LLQLAGHFVETSGEFADLIGCDDCQRRSETALGKIVGGRRQRLDSGGYPVRHAENQKQDEWDTDGEQDEVKNLEPDDGAQNFLPGGDDHHGPGCLGKAIKTADLLGWTAWPEYRSVRLAGHCRQGVAFQGIAGAEIRDGLRWLRIRLGRCAGQDLARIINEKRLVVVPPGGLKYLVYQDIEREDHLHTIPCGAVVSPEFRGQ